MNFLSWSRDFLASSRDLLQVFVRGFAVFERVDNRDNFVFSDFGLLYGGASFFLCLGAQKNRRFSWLCHDIRQLLLKSPSSFLRLFATRQLYL